MRARSFGLLILRGGTRPIAERFFETATGWAVGHGAVAGGVVAVVSSAGAGCALGQFGAGAVAVGAVGAGAVAAEKAALAAGPSVSSGRVQSRAVPAARTGDSTNVGGSAAPFMTGDVLRGICRLLRTGVAFLLAPPGAGRFGVTTWLALGARIGVEVVRGGKAACSWAAPASWCAPSASLAASLCRVQKRCFVVSNIVVLRVACVCSVLLLTRVGGTLQGCLVNRAATNSVVLAPCSPSFLFGLLIHPPK